MTTTELLLSINRCVRSAYQIKVDTHADPHKSSADESGIFPGKQSPITAAFGRKVDSLLFPEVNIFHRFFLYQYLLSFCSSFHKWVVKKEEFCLFLLWQPLACVKHSHQPSCRAVPAGLCPGQRCRWQQSAGFWPVPLAPPRQAEDQPNFGCPPPGTQRAQW